MRKRLLNEDGIALVMALGITVVLIIFVASMIGYTTSNSRASQVSTADLLARQYAEAGLNTAYSIMENQTVTTGGNPAAANLLGCNGASGPSDTAGPSNCSVLTAKVDTSHPLAAGMSERTDVFFDNNPVFTIGPGAGAAGVREKSIMPRSSRSAERRGKFRWRRKI